MPRIQAIDPTAATGKARELLDAVRAKLGKVPNMMRTMASSHVVLQSYLQFSEALGQGVLSHKLREQIALAVGQANACDYCLAAHTLFGKKAGLPEAEVQAARSAQSADPKVQAALRFASALARNRGAVADSDFAALREFGYGDAEIAEIIAVVSLNVFTNYFNTAAKIELDFPPAPAPVSATVG